MVHSNTTWGATVIYGDTDRFGPKPTHQWFFIILIIQMPSVSLFIKVEGATLETAFRVGKEIAEAVTNSNPKPIKLQLEKVCLPVQLIRK